MTIDENGSFWFGTDNGLSFFDGTNWINFHTTNSGLTDNSIRALEFDDNGTLWIGTTTGGVQTFDGTNWNSFTPANSPLPGYFIRALKKDLVGHMWVGTVEGLARFSGTNWDIWTTDLNGLNSNNISCIQVDENDKKYIGTINGGLMYFENETITEYTILEGGIPDNSSIGIAMDQNNLPWFASPSGGLYHDNGSQNWVSYNQNNSGIPTNGLTSIVIDNEHNFFLGSVEQGLIKFTPPATWEVLDTANSLLPDNHILCLLTDDENQIWIGTSSQGIIKLKKNTQNIEQVSVEGITANPNPFSDLLNIKIPDHQTMTHLQVINSSGRDHSESIEYQILGDLLKIETEQLPPGIYFFKVQTENSTLVFRTIKL
jgi:ligand-binding sensor domain-containing protein